MELITLGIFAFAIVAFGVVVTIKCTKAERAYNAEVKALEIAKAEMTQFKKSELERLIAARRALKGI